jgi:general secretion pathway protein D
LAALMLAQASCSTTRVYNQGQKHMDERSYDRAVLMFSKALAEKPGNTRYKVALARARIRAANDHFQKGQAFIKAGRLEAAIAEFQQVVYLAPAHQFAANELAKALTRWQELQEYDESEIEKMKKRAQISPGRVAPRLNPASNIPIVLRFKNEKIEKIYDALSKASGINFIYDERLPLDKSISIDLADVTFERALDTLMAMNKQFYKIWDENTILIAEDNQQKHKEYDDLVIQTFYLSNADVKDVQVLLRTLLDARQLAQNDRLNAITIRDTPNRVRVAQKIIEANDKAKAELIVDIELLEINRNLLQNLGIDLFGPGGGTGKTLNLTYAGGDSVTLNNLDVLRQSGSWLLGPVPGVVVNFLKTDADAQVIAKPQVRVSEGEKAQVRIGDRIPIPTTTFNTTQTVVGSVVPITSFTYQNVGINIDLEPRVHHNREITLKLKVEVSSLAGQVSAGAGISQPIIGTREIETTIRLKDAETNLLAGLIREEERKSLSGVPGLSSIPILRRIFGNTETTVQQTDIVLTLTPHIIRIPDITEADLLPLWIGTEQNIKLKGASRQSAFETNPFEEEERPEIPGIPEPTVEEAPPLLGTLAPAGRDDSGQAGQGPAGDEPGRDEQPPPPEPTPTPPASQPSGDQAGEPGPQGSALVAINPALLTTSTGQEFTIVVSISNARGVASVPFHLAFDPEYLEFVSSNPESPFLSQDGGTVFVLATVGGGGREVIVGLSRQGGQPGVDGQGNLIAMRFRAKKSGRTTVNFTDLSVLDPSANRMPVEQSGMNVEIR